MVIQAKYTLVKILERIPSSRWSDKKGKLETITISQGCCTFLGEVFDTVGEADEYRSLKDHPNDYLIVQVW